MPQIIQTSETKQAWKGLDTLFYICQRWTPHILINIYVIYMRCMDIVKDIHKYLKDISASS